MHILYKSQNVEYRDPFGKDQTISIEIWGKPQSQRVVLILFNLPINLLHEHDTPAADKLLKSQAEQALYHINDTLLPYLLKPDTEVLVLVLKPKPLGHALIFPLSA